jgi:tRNA dimethylallyltransferase
MNKLVVIVGPTASGKSDLAVQLARQFNGEVISADSRQVYRGFDIGSGKITKQEMAGVPHHLLDVANPKKTFTVAEYQKLAQKKLAEIWAKNKLPIIVGGTGLYIRAIVDGIVFPEVAPDLKLRGRLEKVSPQELFKILKKLDPIRAKDIDAKNPRRLIRAIEVATALGRVPKLNAIPLKAGSYLFIGLNPNDQILQKRIKARLIARLEAKGKNNLITEIKKLHENGLSWKRLESLGLEYKNVALYLQKKLTKDQMIERLNNEIWHYAKRQYTWFKRDKRINWLYNQSLYSQQSKKLCLKFLKSSPVKS